MLSTPVTLWLSALSPPARMLASALASKPLGSGWLVWMRKVPAWAAAPYKVPWGPASASTRSMSIMRMSGCEPVWVTETSSR